MNELISEIEGIVSTLKLSIEKSKKYKEQPFMSNKEQHYRFIIQYNTLEVWETCLALLLKYQKKRCIEDLNFKSTDFKKILEFQNKFSGIIPRKNQIEMIEYMKILEWRIEELTNEVMIQ